MRKSFLIATCTAAIAFPATLSAQDALERTGNAARSAAESTLRASDRAVDQAGQAGRNLGQQADQTIDNVNDRARNQTGNQINSVGDASRREMRQVEGQFDRRDQSQNHEVNAHQNHLNPHPMSSGNFQNDVRFESGHRDDVQNFQSHQHAWSPSMANQGPVYMLRYDRWGREFICVNGVPIYFDNHSNRQVNQQTADSNRYQAGFGSYDKQTNHANSDQSGLNSQNRSPHNLNFDESTQNGVGSNGNVDAQVEIDTNKANARGNLDTGVHGTTGGTVDAGDNRAEIQTDLDIDTKASEQGARFGQQSESEIDAQNGVDAELNLDSDTSKDLDINADTDVESEL